MTEKIEDKTNVWSSNVTPGNITREFHIAIYRYLYPMFTPAVFAIGKKLNQPNPTDGYWK